MKKVGEVVCDEFGYRVKWEGNAPCINTKLYAEEKQVEDQHTIIRRIAERGMKLAHEKGTEFVDVFQHILDELQRCSPEKAVADLGCTAEWLAKRLEVADDGHVGAGVRTTCGRHGLANCVSCRKS